MEETKENLNVESVANEETQEVQEFKMQSTRFFRLLSVSGKIINNVILDDEKMTVDMAPKKLNKIPVAYYSEITHVDTRYKLPIYFIILIVISLAATFLANKACAILVLLEIWAGSNWIIKVTLRSGNTFQVYSMSKKQKDEFVTSLKNKANLQ
jgi:hypothetical protein